MDEDVLVLGLDHVVPLGPQAGHVPVHVHLGTTVQYTGTLQFTSTDRFLVLHPLEHGVDDDEGTGPPHPRAAVHYSVQFDVMEAANRVIATEVSID